MNVREWATWVGRNSKRMAITIVGFSLVALGLVGFVFPIIPGFIPLIAGLAVLATEYAWARRALDETKRKAREARRRAGGMFRRKRKG